LGAVSAEPSADSVRLEVLQRVVPSMRHDLMNQLMVIELRTTLLKASMAKADGGADSVNESVAALCDDIREAIDVGRGLARWMHSLEPVSLDQVLQVCQGWVGLAFKCRELALDIKAPEPLPERTGFPWPFAASVEAYYGVLTALWFWFDHEDSAGAQLTVQSDGARGCFWRLEPGPVREDLDPAQGWEMAQRLRITQTNLVALLRAQGWDVRLDGLELWTGCPASGV
jgi:hypothetical protein